MHTVEVNRKGWWRKNGLYFHALSLALWFDDFSVPQSSGSQLRVPCESEPCVENRDQVISNVPAVSWGDDRPFESAKIRAPCRPLRPGKRLDKASWDDAIELGARLTIRGRVDRSNCLGRGGGVSRHVKETCFHSTLNNAKPKTLKQNY